ncbi:unnamed protein product, partial [marine sediment metagenome]
QTLTAHSELGNTGFIRDAQKEFAEGSITLALVTGKQPPDPYELPLCERRCLCHLGYQLQYTS